MNQLDKIRKIMGGRKKKTFSGCDGFTPAEKFHAIYNWRTNTIVDFDLSFIDDVSTYYIEKGKITDKQLDALDKIIIAFKIDLDKWVI